MSNYNDNSSWSERFSWIITIVAMVLVAILSIGLLCALFIQPKEEKKEDTEQAAVIEQASVTDGEGNVMKEGVVYSMPATMSFSAAPLAQVNEPSGATVTNADASIDVRITAAVYPENAAEKGVDYSVAWQNAPVHGSEPVTNYVTVMPDSDGSLAATVSCKKPFGSDTIVITVTTRDGGHTDTCLVTYVGVATEMSISGSGLNAKTTAGRGTYYEVGTSKTYTFNISLSNALGSGCSGDLSVTDIGGEGTMYFGNGSYNDGGYINYSEMYQKDLSELASEFITLATISGNTLTVKTGSKVLEAYYDYSAPDEYYITEILYDRYVVEITDDTMGYKEAGDSFNNQNAKYNAEHIGSCYFYVTVKDNVSGLSQTIRLWLVSSVSGVALSENELQF